MREGEGKVWRVIAEIDNMVFEEGPAGKRIVTVDEVKAGENSKPKEAVDSPKKIKNALRLVASGTAKLFSEQSPFELGTETGATLEWSQLGNIKYETRGAANKTGWGHNLPYDAATLKKAVLSFWDSLPPNVQNQMMPPSTHPDADKDENEPE